VRDAGTAVVAGIRDERVTFIAASLAYYAFVSLLPLLIIALTVASLVGGSAFADSLARRVGEALGPSAGDLVREALTASLAQAGASAFGVVVLLWSGLKLFRGLDIAFSVVYDTPVSGILGRIRNGVVALAAVVAGFGATVGGGTALALFELRVFGVDLLGPAGTIVLFAGLTVVLLPMYYVLPGGGVTVREALPGAVLAGVGWTVLQTGFRIYAAQAANQAYGVLSGVLLLVTLLYFAGMLLLIGVVLNAVLAGRVDTPMSDSDTDDTDVSFRDHAGSGSGPGPDSGDADRGDLEAEVAELRERLAEFEERVDDRTVHREEVESDLRRYVRRRVRRGKARGWGPYLVLLYGTAMTLGAFVSLSGGWAILAMIVIWLSTLGLYVLFLLVGAGLSLAGAPGRLRDVVRDFRQ
jgi:YihY family inner membrane protein